MAEFNLKIVTPERVCFEGSATRVVVKTTSGDVGIMARHANYVAPLAVGRAKVTDSKGNVREAAHTVGMVTVSKEETIIVAETFEWADEIDVTRAQKAAEKARDRLDKNKQGDAEWKMAEYKLKRALNRINVGKK